MSRICTLCGAQGEHECPGPRIMSGGARVLREITLVSWRLDPGYENPWEAQGE